MKLTRRKFALLFGVVFLLVGIAGFVPPLVKEMHPEHPGLIIDANAGQLFGLFPVNVLHNIVHIMFGFWGLAAFRSVAAAKVYARGTAVIFALLLMAAFVPHLDTLFGLVPLFGNDIWLHAVLALIAAYFGWIHRDSSLPVAS